MRVLHLASFGGNYGDILNHQGFYKTIGETLHFDYVKQIEVRRFYKNASEKERLYFNEEFAKKINSYDLFVLGGGGFFDAKWAYSNTGTTIDMRDSFVDSIQVPVIVNGMGYHEYFEETTPEVSKKFIAFIEKIINKGWFISFRNDGSLKRFQNRYGHNYDHRILSVPDNGFFGVDKELKYDAPFVKDKTTIGLCITNDLFTRAYNGELDINSFNAKIVDVLAELSEQYQIVLFTHTPDDVSKVGYFFDNLPNSVKRYNIIIGPYCPNGTESIYEMTRYYRACDIIVGMRFHSLIMGLQLEKPTIALANHSQIGDFFEELGLEKYRVMLNSLSFSEHLIELIGKIQSNETVSKEIHSVLGKLKNQNIEYQNKVISFINN